MMMRLLLIGALFLTGCDNPAPGEPCEVSGDGFQRYDPCSDTCVEWDVTCPNGTTVAPSVCTDGACSTDADCGDGWFCAQINMTDGECLPEDVCPSALTDEADAVEEPAEDPGETLLLSLIHI